MRRSPFVLVPLLAAACAGAPPASGPAAGPDLAAAAATITAADVDRRIAYLASDEMRGRNTPSPELEEAARWIAADFERLGLEPGGDSGTFIQRWPYEAARMNVARLRFDGGDRVGVAQPIYQRDFFLLPSSADSVRGPVVFAGTARVGMSALDASATGKIVAFHAPGSLESSEFGEAVGGALMASMAARPAAVLLILEPGTDGTMIGQVADALVQQMAPVPVAGVTWESAEPAFAAAGADLVALRDGGASPPTAIGELTATITAARAVSETHPPNVVGILRGSDPVLSNTYVVLSAHFDHVGVGAPDETGDSIFNGADDDASGTSVMMEVAEAFASAGVRPARSLIFLAVSGEEKGLFGSRHFVANSPVPLDSIVANVNMDMVGRNAPDSVIGIGLDYTSLGPLVQRIAREQPALGLTVMPDPVPEERLFLRSDHYNFAREGVPAIFFTTGLHDDYHRPSDEPDTIDDDKAARVGRLVFHLTAAVASDPERPTWTDTGRAAAGLNR